LAGTSSLYNIGFLETHQRYTGRTPAPLDPRKHRNNAMRCVLLDDLFSNAGAPLRLQIYLQ